MFLFDFLFPSESAAMQLRRIAEQKEQDRRLAEVIRRNQERRRKREFAAEKAASTQAAVSDEAEAPARLDQLEEELHRANLIIAALVTSLEDKGALNRDELRGVMARLDAADGRQDGGLDSATLKRQIDR
ncbi:MAG: hypothetical protein RL095_1783 [Verrucomicrobiota bacterium]|jgi:hypothetical protein